MRSFSRALAWIAAVAVTLVAVDVYFLLSPRQLEKRLRETLSAVFRAPLEIREIGLSLRHGLRVRGLIVYGPEGEEVISVEEAAVAIDWRRLALGEIRLVGPSLDVRRRQDGTVSLLEVLDPALLKPSAGPPRELPKLALRIEDARVRYRDDLSLVPGQVLGVDDLDLEVST